MASAKQVEFFNTLLQDKQFPQGSPTEDQLRQQFANIPDKSASEWIEKAMALPDKGAVAPPF